MHHFNDNINILLVQSTWNFNIKVGHELHHYNNWIHFKPQLR